MTIGDLQKLDFKSESSRRFVAHWFSLRRDALVPNRVDFDPTRIRDLLPNISIHEFTASGRIEMRLVGTDQIDRYGQEVTGRNYLDFIPERRRPKTHELLSHIIHLPCAMLVRMRSITTTGIRGAGNESVGVPFYNQDGRLNQVRYHVANWEYDRLSNSGDQRIQENLPAERFYIDVGAGVPDWSDEPYPVGDGGDPQPFEQSL